MADDLHKNLASAKFRWVRQVALDDGLPGSAMRVAAWLVDNFQSNDDGRACRAIAAFMADLNLSERGVQKSLASLIDHGHLAREIGGGRKNFNVFSMVIDGKEWRPSVRGSSEKPRKNVPENPRTSVRPLTVKSSVKRDISTADAQFEAFWQHFPRHVAKGAAKRAFTRAIQSGIDPLEIISGAMRYAAERDGQDPKFTKHGATWLRGECWLDEPSRPHTAPINGRTRSAADLMHEAYTNGDLQ